MGRKLQRRAIQRHFRNLVLKPHPDSRVGNHAGIHVHNRPRKDREQTQGRWCCRNQPCKCRGSKKAKFLEKKLFIRVLTFDVNTTFPIQRNGRKGHPIPSGSLAAQSCPLLDRDHPSCHREQRPFCVDFKPGLINLGAEVHEKSAIKLRDF